MNEQLVQKLNERLAIAGMEVVEARINYLAYAPEIAAVMLRRQQASAIIMAREKIVEGAVSMVKMALDKLSTEEIVELDEEKKADQNWFVIFDCQRWEQVSSPAAQVAIFMHGRHLDSVFHFYL